jgi:hypothetical protein
VSTNCVYMAPVLVLAMMLACQWAAEVAGFAAAPPAALDIFRRSACWVPPAARCERGGALRSARRAGAPDISVAHRRRRECKRADVGLGSVRGICARPEAPGACGLSPPRGRAVVGRAARRSAPRRPNKMKRYWTGARGTDFTFRQN